MTKGQDKTRSLYLKERLRLSQKSDVHQKTILCLKKVLNVDNDEFV